MAQFSDIDQIRKKRRRKILLGRALLLVVLTLTGAGLYVVKGKVHDIDPGGFLSSALASVAPGPGFPLDFASEQVKGLYSAGRCLVVLTDTNLFIYNPNGKLLRNVQHKFSSPMVRVDGRRILLYDCGGKRLRVESFTKTEAELEFEYPIYAADISGGGDVAVAVGAQHYTAELLVFDPTYEQNNKFSWKSPDQYVVDISFTQDNNGIVAAAVSAQGGDFVSRVRQYRLDSPEMAAETELRGELVHSIVCVRDGVLAVTDARTALLNPTGDVQAAYDYHYEALAAYAHSDNGMTALVFGSGREDKTGTLIVLDGKAEVLWERKISSHTTLLSLGEQRLGLVADGTLTVYDNAGLQVSRSDVAASPLGLEINGTKAYLITPEMIEKLPA